MRDNKSTSEKIDNLILKAKEQPEVMRFTKAKKIALTALIIGLILFAAMTVIYILGKGSDTKIVDIARIAGIVVAIIGCVVYRLLTNKERDALQEAVNRLNSERTEDKNLLDDTGVFAESFTETNVAISEKAYDKPSETSVSPEKSMETRVSDMRKHILFDIFIIALLIMFILAMLLPYITILGEKYNVFSYAKAVLQEEIDPSTGKAIETDVFNRSIFYYAWKVILGEGKFLGTFETAEIAGEMNFILFAIMGLSFIGSAIMYMARYVRSYVKTEDYIKNEKIPVAQSDSVGKKLHSYGSSVAIANTGFVFMLIFYLPAFDYLWKETDGNALGELFSVSPFMIILPLLVAATANFLWAIQRVRANNNEQLKNDMAYFDLYRGRYRKKRG